MGLLATWPSSQNKVTDRETKGFGLVFMEENMFFFKQNGFLPDPCMDIAASGALNMNSGQEKRDPNEKNPYSIMQQLYFVASIRQSLHHYIMFLINPST